MHHNPMYGSFNKLKLNMLNNHVKVNIFRDGHKNLTKSQNIFLKLRKKKSFLWPLVPSTFSKITKHNLRVMGKWMRTLKKIQIGFYKSLTSRNVQENYPWVPIPARAYEMFCHFFISFTNYFWKRIWTVVLVLISCSFKKMFLWSPQFQDFRRDLKPKANFLKTYS